MIHRLRQETKELHEQIESKNPAAAILDHSISLEAYRHLLLQNYVAYRTMEKEINRFFPEYTGLKHLQLKKDLERLDISPEMVEYSENFHINSFAEALGAAYVVEGSAMGGMVIARHLKHCSLEGVGESHFFSGTRVAV
ncbi:biliverdin-producing heme oxygenase, partial [Longispora fulva]|uniref:biliverdin-producing heme oxygenase n=1 Tax=Longispora fulva TaxID=619741 RepID=UPI0036413BD1